MPEATTTKTDSQGQEAPPSNVKTMWVVSGREDNRVAHWDPDPQSRHPGGEAFVAGKVPDEVALTSEVNKLLREGTLRPATDAEIAKRKAQLGAAAVEAPKGPWD